MGSRRVYVAQPGQVPTSASTIRDDGAGGTVTVECGGGTTSLQVTRGVAALVIGNKGRGSLSLLGPEPPQIAACRKKCTEALGKEYFTEADGVFLPPRAEVFDMAVKIISEAVDKVVSRESIIVARPTSVDVARPTSVDVARPTSARRASTSSSFAETHAAERTVKELEKKLEKLIAEKARVEKNRNRVLRGKLIKGVEVKIANVSKELEVARRAL
tara:strand:+ start:607 stop:1254 length:648 start_codon:yes stop_codon:yes gene_type:complete